MKKILLLLAAAGLGVMVEGQTPVKDSALRDTVQMSSVVVRGVKAPVQQQPYGTVLNIENSVLTKGSSVLDVLGRSPGVLLDHHNNAISLNGKSGVTVMINGKLVPLSGDQMLAYLSSLSADNVEKIELLTTPPSRYDAAGSAGMINIVLKKSKKIGTSGSFSLTGGSGWGEKGGVSVSADHNTGKTDWYGSYSFFHDRTWNSFFAAGSEIAPVVGGAASFNFWSTMTQVRNSHNGVLGFERKLGDGWVVGASVTYNHSGGSAHTVNRGMYYLQADSTLSFNGVIDPRSWWNNTIGSVTVEREIQKGEKLGVSADYIDYDNHQPSNVVGNFVDNHGKVVGVAGDSLFASAQKGYSNTRIRVGVGKVDYSRSLGEHWRVEAGLKETYTRSSSLSGVESFINGVWVESLAAVNDVNMREHIDAGYVSAHVAWGGDASAVGGSRAGSVDVGARYEYSRTQLVDGGTGKVIADRPLRQLFPNFLLSQQLNDHAELQLSYSRRISRPSFSDLSSFISYNDPFSVFTGNPLLLPTITDNIKAGFVYKGYSFSVTASRDDHPIIGGSLASRPGSLLVYICPQNLDYQNNLIFEWQVPVRVNAWWNMSYGFVGGWHAFRVSYTQVPAEKTYFGYSVNFRQDVRLPAGWSAEFSGWYNSTSYYGAYKNLGRGSLDAGVKKELKKNKGVFQLSAVDITRSMSFRSFLGDVTEEVFYTKSFINWNAESRRFPILKLTYTRSFGGGGHTARAVGTVGDERGRVK